MYEERCVCGCPCLITELPGIRPCLFSLVVGSHRPSRRHFQDLAITSDEALSLEEPPSGPVVVLGAG
jgi:hypothetical protein